MSHHISQPLAPRIISQNGFDATFVIENCFPGYGITLGNSMQRVLLSSLPGAAIVGAKIDGVDHEFMALDGVMEDVLTILLNLKKVRLSISTNETVRGTLSISGGKKEVVVKAGDLKFPSDVRVINPSLPIATLTAPKTNFKLEVIAEAGLGYRPAAENKTLHDFETGVIAIDSIFSPVQKVNYRVENMRVGERTDFNRVEFFIGTDGSMSPEAALADAASLLVSQFEKLTEVSKKMAKKPAVKKPAARRASKIKDTSADSTESAMGEQSLGELKLSARIANILEEAKISTANELTAAGEAGLGQIPGIGDKAVKEIRRKLGRLGLILTK